MNLIIDCTTTQDQLKYHGIGNYTRDLVTTMVTKFPHNTYFLLLFDAETTLPFEVTEAANVEKVSLGKFHESGYKNILWYKRQFEPAIIELLKSHPDAKYFAPYFWRYFPAKLLPTYVTIHDLAFPKFNIYSQQSFLHNFLRRFQYWDAMNWLHDCAGVMTDSEYTRKELLRYMPTLDASKVKTVLLGIDLDLSGLQEKKEVQIECLNKYISQEVIDAGYFIYLGGTPSSNKNSAGVFRAYAEFVREAVGGRVASGDGEEMSVRGAQKDKNGKELPYLVVAGKAFLNRGQREVAKLYELIDELGIKERVVFSGFYDDKDKCILLGNAVAMIHLSLYEGFGLAVGEGMKCGVPVIAHNGSSYVEVVGDGGILVDGENAVECGEALFKVWSDEGFARKVGDGGKVWVEGFTWRACADGTLGMMDEVNI